MSLDIDRLIRQRDYHRARARLAERVAALEALVIVAALVMVVW